MTSPDPVSELLAQASRAIAAGWWSDARTLLEQAQQIDGRRPDVLINLGLACLNIGAPREAAVVLKKAVVLRPDIPDAHSNLGLALSATGRHKEAVASLTRAVRLAPADARLLHDLGVVCHAAGDPAAAMAAFRRALGLEPSLVEARFNLGTVLRLDGQPAAAEAAWREVLQDAPGHLPSALNLGSLLVVQKRPADALACFDGILAQLEGGDAGDGVRVVDALAALHNGRGNALHDLERLDEALDAFARAAALDPDSAEIRYNLGNQQLQLGLVDSALATFRQVLRLDPAHAQAAQNLLYSTNYADAMPAAEVAQLHRMFGPVAAGQRAGQAVAAPPPKPSGAPRAAGVCLRIGFVSADLRTHSVAWFLLPALAALDRDRFEVHLYPTAPTADDMTARLRAASAGWHPIDTLDDAAAARQVRADGIDLLVDLSGHTAGQRLGLFARRPAPRQATWLGYPNTTGLPQMDCRLVDAITDPGDAAQRLASERLLRIDGCFVCYRPPSDAPDVAPRRHAAGGDDPGQIVFGSFNNLQKLSASTLDLWSRLLAAEPGSRLALKAGSLEQAGVQARLRAAFAARGIDPDRLQFLPREPGIATHLARYAGIDVALDTYPYHGTTTTCEALWMGVPVISLAGDRHASRVGASLLAAAGCPQWSVQDEAGFIAAAREAARQARADPSSRLRLRKQLAGSLLLDGARFAANFGAAVDAAVASD
ncbi:MAG: tetratricopeptide repeat protein [bacterium]|jgi:predicted O-linked N-acetylglucosamine transferase (SPINDLY family)|nr:tetratricopeptide repeat protein [Betaproteobacteria bacterium]